MFCGVLSLPSPASSAGEFLSAWILAGTSPSAAGSGGGKSSAVWLGFNPRAGERVPSLAASALVSRAVGLAGPLLPLPGKSRLGPPRVPHPRPGSALPLASCGLLFTGDRLGMARGTRWLFLLLIAFASSSLFSAGAGCPRVRDSPSAGAFPLCY